MTWSGRKPPCYEFDNKNHVYVFHVSETESVELSPIVYLMAGQIDDPGASLIRLLGGVSPVEMLSDPRRWARWFGSKEAK